MPTDEITSQMQAIVINTSVSEGAAEGGLSPLQLGKKYPLNIKKQFKESDLIKIRLKSFTRIYLLLTGAMCGFMRIFITVHSWFGSEFSTFTRHTGGGFGRKSPFPTGLSQDRSMSDCICSTKGSGKTSKMVARSYKRSPTDTWWGGCLFVCFDLVFPREWLVLEIIL
jgi:hypothetical protein